MSVRKVDLEAIINGWPHIYKIELKNLQVRIEIWLIYQFLGYSEASDDLRNLHSFLLQCPVLGDNKNHCIRLHLSMDQVVRICLRIASSMNLDEENSKIICKFSLHKSMDHFSPDFISFTPWNRNQPLASCEIVFTGQSLHWIFIDCPVPWMKMEL